MNLLYFSDVFRKLPSWSYSILALLAGGIIPLSFAPFNIWLFGIVGLVILALLINQQSLKTVLWRSWLFAVGMYAVGVSWVYVSISGFGGAPIPLALLLVGAFVCFLASVFSVSFYLYGRWFSHHFLGLLIAFPVSWLISEWLRTWLFTGFPWLFVGYAHVHTWLAGWAPIVGVLGISFIVALCAGFIAQILFNPKKIFPLAIAGTLAVTLLATGFFLQRVEWTQASAQPISIAMVQPNVAQENKWQADFQETTLELLKQQTENLWNHKIIIWPEAAVTMVYSDAIPFLNEINRRAADSHAGLITGIIYDDPYKNPGKYTYYNSVVTFGDAIGIYHKRRLVPFGEYVPMEWLRNIIEFFNLPTSIISLGPDNQHGLKIDDIAISPSVCYEVAYPDLVAKSAVNSQLLMSVSNLGWFGDSLGRHQFLEMAQMRALETQHYFAYSTNNGPSAIIDRKGNITAQTQAFKQTTLSGEVFSTDGITPFMRWGSWPVIVMGFLCLLTLCVPLINRRKFAVGIDKE